MCEDENKRIKAYFLQNARKVLKKPIGELKYPFLDPGSGYEGDLWDWDSYFTAKALCAAFAPINAINIPTTAEKIDIIPNVSATTE